MNDPDASLRAHFAERRARDEKSAPAFAAMSGRARVLAATPGSPLRSSAWLWLAPLTAAIVIACVLWPRAESSPAYADRIAALVAELDGPALAGASLPSDLLPSAFPEL